MKEFQLTPDMLAMIAGVILTLAFSYIPGLNTAFAKWSPELKRITMLALLLLTSAVVYGLGCAGILNAGLTCDKQGLVQLIWMFILAVISNQSVYQITPLPASVRLAGWKQ
jgi:hypothetical protein